MLTTVDLDDEALFKTNKIENEALKRHLPAKFETRQSPIAEQSPNGGLGIGRLAAHLLCEAADALGGRPMVWRLWREPLTRRLTS